MDEHSVTCPHCDHAQDRDVAFAREASYGPVYRCLFCHRTFADNGDALSLAASYFTPGA